MKRSQINKSIKEAIAFFKKNNFTLPLFAYWQKRKWQANKSEYQEVLETRLGWDVTNFGSNNFTHMGRTIFTLRNGKYNSKKYPKTYAQKIMMLNEGQKSPIHYHKRKMEDIINLAGGNIVIRFWKAGKNGILLKNKLTVKIDGGEKTVAAGKKVVLKNGESVCIVPGTYHEFYAEERKGKVMSGEVSSVCDDLNDNFWLKKAVRFPVIEENEPQKYILCSEYKILFTH